MIRLFFFLVIVCIHGVASAQIYIDRDPVGSISNGQVVIYGPDAVPRPIPYERINGSPFWNSGWQPASLYSIDKRIALLPARINLATNTIHFLLRGQELESAPENNITAVYFHAEGDTAVVTAVFRYERPDVPLKNTPSSVLMQVLNEGDHALLKYIQRTVKTEDSLFRTQQRYLFKDAVFYFLKSPGKVQRIKKLSAEALFSLLPGLKAYTDWMKQNTLNLKKEEDAIRLLDHYNTQLKQ